jgi:tetratricopeptide (TPR) repeat protein
MRITTFTRFFPLLILLATVLVGCASQPEEIPENLEPIEYFQRAQKIASEDNNYQLAITYYRTFIERYPDDIQRIVEAKYEIAFLSYKQGNYDLARQQFEELLSYYENQGSSVLPRWPQVLAQKVLNKMESETAGAAPAADISQTAPPTADTE